MDLVDLRIVLSSYTLWFLVSLRRAEVALWSEGCAYTLTVKKSHQLVTQLCLTLCDPMDCSTPGFAVHHQLPELTQTHVHRVSDAIQPSHPLSSPSPPAFSLF